MFGFGFSFLPDFKIKRTKAFLIGNKTFPKSGFSST